MELSITNLLLLGLLYFVGKKLYRMFKDYKNQELLDRWNNTARDKLIVHGPPRGKTLPSIGPFVLKVETYLRMANIPYELDTTDIMGPKVSYLGSVCPLIHVISKGKTPWISLNGTHIADSTLILQFLNKKFEKNLNGHLSPELKEMSRAMRIILEEHFVWGLASWRWVESVSSIHRIMTWPKIMTLFIRFQSAKVEKSLYAQGLGRHTFSERTEMTAADLRTVSVILGNKHFIAGDQPSEDDCGIFSMLAQVVYAAPDSPFEKLVEDELPNLKQYCIRMKDKYWPDWTACLEKSM